MHDVQLPSKHIKYCAALASHPPLSSALVPTHGAHVDPLLSLRSVCPLPHQLLLHCCCDLVAYLVRNSRLVLLTQPRNALLLSGGGSSSGGGFGLLCRTRDKYRVRLWRLSKTVNNMFECAFGAGL